MFNRTLQLLILFLAISQSISYAWHDYVSYGDWNYHGSGRDHPYSAYIDRYNYVGPADYAMFKFGYADEPPVIPVPPIPIANPPVKPGEYVVNIPNRLGGFNAVVITKSGDGYKGPNGEYYPEFPKIFQLQMKYGK